MSEFPPVSNELKSMVGGAAAPRTPDETVANRMLAFMSAAMIAVVVCMSITAANFNASSEVSTVKTTKIIYEASRVADIAMSMAGVKSPLQGENICASAKVDLPNIPCFQEIATAIDDEALDYIVNGTRFALGTAEQAGANVTKGYQGEYDTEKVPISSPYFMEGMCPVNVHWHLGAEHLSVGEFDENGKGPAIKGSHRELAEGARLGHRCHHYDDTDTMFTREYNWKHCVGMHVGETYEVHWPHSNMGDCGTPNQYQTPFYDGVFCNFRTTFEGSLAKAKIGVQGQVFTIVNDDAYYYPDLIRGMIVDGDKGKDVTKYTGSTTGTTRNNTMCSQYTGITWQVDRKCHMISASSFDKMCADMGAQRDDMSGDFYAHGSREVVKDELAADNFLHKLR